MHLRNRTLSTALALVSTILLARCSTSNPASPSPAAVAGESLIVGETTTSTPAFGQLKVCKVGNVSGTFTVSATPVSGGTATTLSPITVAAGQCRVVAEDFDATSGVGSNITVTETSAGLQSISAQRIDLPHSVISSFSFTNGQTVFLNSFHGYAVTFTNNVQPDPPPPPPGDEGCTPGYWKEPQHLINWTGYAPGADFDTTFGVNFFTPNITLLQAARLGGGDLNALARHGVAALLNAASADVDYAYTTAQVLAIVRGTGAYAGLTVAARKDLLVAANEAGCPLS
jgi:hypothetical protein